MVLVRAAGILLSTALAVALAFLRPSPLLTLDRLVYDGLVRGDATGLDQGQTAVVAIDESSLARIGQWPWPRDVVAELVDRLAAMGATVIAFDTLFAEADRGSRDGDATLSAALRRTPSVIGYAFVFAGASPRASAVDCAVAPVELVERQRGDQPPRAGLLAATGTICTLPDLAKAAGISGFINVTPDSDGLLRSVPLLLRQGDDVFPALSLAAVRRAAGGGPVVIDARADDSLALTVGRQTVGLDHRGHVLVRHGTSIGRVVIPAADILSGSADPGQVRGRIVFVGATALGLRDIISTAAERGIPGVMVHAAVADTLLGGPAFDTTDLAPLVNVGSALLCAVTIGLVGARYGILAAVGSGAVLAVIAGWGARAMLINGGVLLSPLWAWTAIVVAVLVQGGTSLIRERRRADREKRRRGDAQRLIIHALTTLTETRDADTGRHARRTQELTRILAGALARNPAYRRSLDADRVDLISTLAPLHDIGKVGVPDAVLRKPGALTPAEHEEMRRHPGLGYDTLTRAEALAGVHDNEVVSVAKDIVYTHHERWDGSGYPRGLKGQAIPVSGRIVALVDAYDAMVETRAYHAGVTHAEAVRAVQEGSGTHFDPDIVAAFLTVHEQFHATVAHETPPAGASPAS